MWPFEPETADESALELYRRAVSALRNEPEGPQNDREWADLGRQLNRLAALEAVAEPETARTLFEEAISIWNEIGRPKAAIVSQMRLAVVLARLEEFDEAHEIVEHLLDLAAANPAFGLYFDSIVLHRAAIFCAAGDAERASEDLQRVAEIRAERKPGSEEPIVAWLASLD